MRGADIFPAYEDLVVPPAMRAALWARDPSRVATALARMEASPFTGKRSGAKLAWARAGAAAIEGEHVAAVAGFRDSVERLRELGEEFEVALMMLDAIYLLPGKPEVREWADDARATFERLRAKPSLERLDTALAAGREHLGSLRDTPGRPVVAQQVEEGDGVERLGTLHAGSGPGT